MKNETVLHAGRRQKWGLKGRDGMLLGAAAMLAFACAAASEPWPEPDAALYDVAIAATDEAGSGPDAPADPLDSLRNSAAVGDVEAGVQLVQGLSTGSKSAAARTTCTKPCSGSTASTAPRRSLARE